MISARIERVAAPLAIRGFRLLWTGQAVSSLGNVLQTVAIAWLVLDLTGSPVALGGVLLSASLPGTLVTLIGGVVADQYNPRTVMVWSDTIRAAAIGLVAALAIQGTLGIGELVVLLAIHGAAGGFFAPSANSIVPRIVPEENLPAANSLSQVTPQLAMITGAPLAGALVGMLGPGPVLALNAASFAASALAALAIRLPDRGADGSPRDSARVSALAGFSYVRERTWLWSLLLVDAVLGFAAMGPLAVGLPVVARRGAGGGAEQLGVMLAGFGAGSLVGMLWLGSHPRVHRRGRTFCALQLPQGALLAGLTFVPPPLMVTSLTVVGMLSGASAVIFLDLIQSRSDRKMMGRVMSFVALFSSGAAPLSLAASGAIAAVSGPRLLFLAAGLLMTSGAVAGFLVPSLRELD